MLDASKLKTLREQLLLSQVDVAKRIGKDRQYVWKLEHGVRVDVRASTLEKLADVLQCTTDYLLGRDEQRRVA